MSYLSRPVKSLGIKVERGSGERLRRELLELGLLDRSRRITSDDSHVYIPIQPLNGDAERRLSSIGCFELVEIEFDAEEKRSRPEDILGYRPDFEVIGDIAVIGPENEEEVAAALMSLYKSIKTVIVPLSDVEGEFRTRSFRHVAGEARTTTIYKEHGLRYRIDLEKAYFSPRLGTERLRVAKQVKPGDFVLDMFAGVGPFALLLAKRRANVVAIDMNPEAVKCLRENALANKVDVKILEGDAAKLVETYENWADHTIMNLPHSASAFLSAAVKSAKSGGIIHYYAISLEDDLYSDENLIKEAVSVAGASLRILYRGIVRSYAPHRYNVVIDFQVIKP